MFAMRKARYGFIGNPMNAMLTAIPRLIATHAWNTSCTTSATANCDSTVTPEGKDMAVPSFLLVMCESPEEDSSRYGTEIEVSPP